MQAETPGFDITGDAKVRASAATAPIPGLVWAFRIHSVGRPEILPVDQPIAFGHDGLFWLHFNLADARALQWLTPANLQVPPQARGLLLSKDTYQQVHTLDECVYGVISDLRREIGQATEDTGYLRFIMTEHILVSGRHQALCAVDATRRALEGGLRVENVAALFEAIIENVADTMDQIADRVAGDLDELEEQVLADGATDVRQSLGRLRRTCVRLHRQLSGLRIIFLRLEQRNPGTLKPALQFRAGKLAQRLDDLDHTIVEMRERSRLLQEELHLKIEEQGNNNIRALSILTALLMPPTLVTGIFGMNIKGLPFTDLEAAFLWTALLMLMASFAAYFIMKRIGVIR